MKFKKLVLVLVCSFSMFCFSSGLYASEIDAFDCESAIVDAYKEIVTYSQTYSIYFEMCLEDFAKIYNDSYDSLDEYKNDYYQLFNNGSSRLSDNEIVRQSVTREIIDVDVRPEKTVIDENILEELLNDSSVLDAYNEFGRYLRDGDIPVSVSLETFATELYLSSLNPNEFVQKTKEEFSSLEINGNASIQSSGGYWYYNTGYSLPQTPKYSKYNLLERVKKGDLIYDGQGSFGLTGHMAIVEGKFYDKNKDRFYIRVIEAISDGVCRSVLDDDRVDQRESLVLRVPSADSMVKDNAVLFAQSQVGKNYYIDLLHDTDYGVNDWYCSELVWASYYNSGIDLETPNTSAGVTPRELRDSSKTAYVNVSGTKQKYLFSDIVNHWAKGYVYYVSDNGIMNGITTTSFSPDLKTSRAMAITAIYNTYNGAPYFWDNCFTDVSSSAYYADAVYWGKYMGVVSGVTSTQFSPNASVTREQLVTFLYRYARICGCSTIANGNLNQFSDRGQISEYAVTPMKWAVGYGLINGRDSNTLAPQGTASRAEVACLLQRFMTKLM